MRTHTDDRHGPGGPRRDRSATARWACVENPEWRDRHVVGERHVQERGCRRLGARSQRIGGNRVHEVRPGRLGRRREREGIRREVADDDRTAGEHHRRAGREVRSRDGDDGPAYARSRRRRQGGDRRSGERVSSDIRVPARVHGRAVRTRRRRVVVAETTHTSVGWSGSCTAPEYAPHAHEEQPDGL